MVELFVNSEASKHQEKKSTEGFDWTTIPNVVSCSLFSFFSQFVIFYSCFSFSLRFLTGVLGVLAQLELHASVELPGDQPIGHDHHHPRDEEQDEQQQHIPGEEK